MFRYARICILISGIFAFNSVIAQTPTQVVWGKVTDAEAKTPLYGANVVILNTDPLLGATTNSEGTFIIDNVKVGRHTIKITYVGYRTAIIPEIMVTSGKQTVLNVELEDMVITSGEVEVKAVITKDKPVDAMAVVGARSFNVEESRRYAGSLDDPMRAVSNLAGVVSNAGVNSNQIMIRGNSPKGLLWRVEGMDIPNPNHFAFVGTSGGGFTIFSSQVLSNSDFYTAAFPAQFGNALSGVFDMRFRNGNKMRHEYAVQFGVQGIEVAAEGPFSKKNSSSYLFNYRYSILYFLQYIDPWMKNKVPSFQDLSFKIHLPENKLGTFTLVGIGGMSRYKSTPEKDSSSWNTIEDRSQSVLNNRMGALALIHQIYLTKQSYLRSYISGTYNEIVVNEQLMSEGYTVRPVDSVMQRNYRVSASVLLNQKFGSHYTVRCGITYVRMFYNIDMKNRNPFTGIYGQVAKGKGNTGFTEIFGEAKIDLTNNLCMTAGVNFQYFMLNGHYSLEPRYALRWQAAPKHALSIGYGMHSQLEDVGLYMVEMPGNNQLATRPNGNLNFSRAHHVVLGYDFLIRQDIRFKTELYYQYLYDVPVIPGSFYSMINNTGGYTNEVLVNQGTGRNTGIDFTVEKFLTKQYYYLATISLFDSKYRGGDGINRNTRFNTNYVVNLLGGKEWTFREKNFFGVNLKASITGGEHYIPIDLEKSIALHREILIESSAYAPKLPSVFFLDLTVTYRVNHRKFSGIWAIQVRNLLNQHPDIGYLYNDFNHTIEPQKSLGILPVMSYKVEF
jgi:hypothetical protein